jgi:hypothetical protein
LRRDHSSPAIRAASPQWGDFRAGARRAAQVTIIGNDDPAAPGISVEVDDVDAVHAIP